MMSSTSSNTDFNTNAHHANRQPVIGGRLADRLRPNIGSAQITDRQTVDSDLAQQAASAVLNGRFHCTELERLLGTIELNERRVSVIELNERVNAIELNERVNAIELNERESAIELNSKMSFMELNWRGCVIHMNGRESAIELNGSVQLFITNTSITMTMITNTKCRKYPRSARTLPKAFRCPSKLVPRNVTM
ncbi:hypothetical protein DPMN_187740 [Dreissena polymorpha]|uniref:Uncharacterized protein n=1 Tax=Dreissena polymorpha TaxID=45954 RepID=A0A9D4DRN2_DREPO|nr:hypothetical protein DPMN_187740 [Dreissena polymorpha]